MKCERLIKLIKNWYVQVQSEAMAPARMVDFMRNHLDTCSICQADPVVESEVKKIIDIVMPPVKPAKAIRKDDEAGGDFDGFEDSGEYVEEGAIEDPETADDDEEGDEDALAEDDLDDLEDDDF